MVVSQLSHYRILAPLGRGGMGEVYRARDLRLGREVALKLLPPSLAHDPERLARFRREARLLASLNHPRIATIHEFEETDQVPFLVMEVAEGEDLSTRMGRGAVPVDEAVEIARQIAEGLEAAHELGIVHRDLKPSNVKVSDQGSVKILDFGLARVHETADARQSSDPVPPTISIRETRPGMILGTASYMSPEQAQGKPTDCRADIWALGVLLFEMLSGKRLFVGDTFTDILAAVLRADIRWEDLPAETPPTLLRLLRLCLQRDPRLRLRSAGDVGIQLADLDSATGPQPGQNRRALRTTALLGVMLSLAVFAWTLGHRGAESPPLREPIHSSLVLPDGYQIASRHRLPLGSPQPGITLSSDGCLIVCTVEDDSSTWLYRRWLDRPEGEIIPGSEGAYSPAISPSGEWISFMSGHTLKKVEARGERVTTLRPIPASVGQCWRDDDEIIVCAEEGRALFSVSAREGTMIQVRDISPRRGYAWPSRIPMNSQAVLLNSVGLKWDEARAAPIYMQWLDGSRRELVGLRGSQPRVLPDGVLLVVRDGALVAAAFDPEEPSRLLRPVSMLDRLLVEGWIGQYAISEQGTLVYAAGSWLKGKELVWADQEGNLTPTGFPIDGYGDFALSPDGSRVAVTLGGSGDSIWIYDLQQRTRSRLTTEDADCVGPTWSPGGEAVAYGALENGIWTLRVRTVGAIGEPRILLESPNGICPFDWHRDLGLLIYATDNVQGIYQVDPDHPTKMVEVVASRTMEWAPDVSPDGRWMTYTSEQTGRFEVYVRPNGESGSSIPISMEGGCESFWCDGGTSLFYRNENSFYRLEILEADPISGRFRVGRPTLFTRGNFADVPGLSYAVHPDGDRILVLLATGGPTRPDHLDVVLNWDVELARKLRSFATSRD